MYILRHNETKDPIQVEGVAGELDRDVLKGRHIRKWSYVDLVADATTYSTPKLADDVKYLLGNHRWLTVEPI